MSGRPESLPCISFFSSYMHTKHGSYCLYSSTDSTDITESTECTTDSLARSMYHTRNGTRFHMKRNIRIPMKLSGVPCLRLRGEMVISAVVAQGAEQRVQVSSMQVKQDGCTHGKGVAVLAVVVSILLADSVRSFVMPTPTSWTSMSTAHRHVASSCCRQGRHYEGGGARRVALAMTASDAPAAQTPLAERLEPAPSTFEQCIRQAQAATEQAFADGLNLVEVEFPPLQTDFLEDSGSSAYDVSSANVRLATRFAQSFAAQGKEVAVLFPDEDEMDRAAEDEGGVEISKGVTLRTLRESGTRVAESLDALFMSFVGRGGGVVKPLEGVDMYVAIIFSCQELPDLQELHAADPDAKIVFFNLRLDTLRGDLGLPAFPPKSVHYKFLSKITPVYLLRTRSYSRSITKKPFLVNYQGAQFRVYPGRYQCLLDTGSRYKMVEASTSRQTLGAFKDILTKSLKIDEITAEENNPIVSFFRKGYKNKTWWEEESEEEEASNWRT